MMCALYFSAYGNWFPGFQASHPTGHGQDHEGQTRPCDVLRERIRKGLATLLLIAY
ncbi:hypothetical protein DPMN_007457 [Dreissena polymorpha]|uniref:Uncharacterized protein n=1 Tax=Dreissena polymorpha TaxID=45954 RepID=A0A9D4RYA4_DREPO|nr:hypothetical protein DPMN_007457 [Dreissena polymorpha]